MAEQETTNDKDYSIPKHMVLSIEEGLAERNFNIGKEKGTEGVMLDRFELTPVVHLRLTYVRKPWQ